MAVLGYAVIWSALFVGMGLLVWVCSRWLSGQTVGLAFLLTALGALSLVVSVLRALWTPFPAPTGRRVTRDQAPSLFKMLDKVRERTNGPRFDEVLIDGRLNASVVQRPRLGLLGCYRNTLVLGLPLLFLLNPRQLASVVAHEYGHLSQDHGKLGAWVYRTRRSWSRLAELRDSAGDRGSFADVALNLFFTRFFPRFNARAFVLSRQQEYEADATAHDVSGAQASSQALIAIYVAERYLQEVFWPEVFARARQGGELGQNPYRELRSRLALSLAHPQAAVWLSQAYKKLPSIVDSHPSLRQRLDFARQKPELPEPVGDKSAATLLGKAVEVVLASLDTQWQRDHSAVWSQTQRAMAARVARLNALNEKREKAPLNSSEVAERAECIEITAGAAEALPAWQEAQREFPQHAEIAYGLARLMSEESDEYSQRQAFELWSLVAGSDSRHAVQAMERCIAWLEGQDRNDESLPAWRVRLKDRQQREQEAEEERLDFSSKPFFSPSELTRPQLQDCLDVLIRERAVGAAYLVRKQTRNFSHRPFYVLMIERSRAPKQPSPAHYASRLQEKVNLPGEFIVIDCAHKHWKDHDANQVLQQIKRMNEARIYGGSALGGR